MQDGLVELNPVNLNSSVASSSNCKILHTLDLVSHRKSNLSKFSSCRDVECRALTSCNSYLTALRSLNAECHVLRSLLTEVELVECNLVTSLGEYSLPTLEVVSSVEVLDSCTVDSAVTVDVYLLSRLDRSYTTLCRLDLLDSTVLVEVKLLDTSLTALVKVWRVVVVVIEEIPLTLVVDDTVVVCPAAVIVLSHDDTLVLVWSHRVL